MKKFLKIFGIVIGLFIIIFSILKIREYIDSHTEFKLNDNKFILDYAEVPTMGGLASDNYYYEIDLEKKIIDYRYDFEYWDIPINSWFSKTFGNKRRKLEHRYHITDDVAKELKNLYLEYAVSDFEMNNKEISWDYYFLKTNNGNFKINDNNKVIQILSKNKRIIKKLK